VSLRIDDSLRKRLAASARRRDTTPSELARSAIELWLDHEEGRVRLTPAESLGEIVGSVAGGTRDRSTSSAHLGRSGATSRSARRIVPSRKK
jgi:hypothetical protein